MLVACGGDDGGNTAIDASIDTPAATCTISNAQFGDRGAIAGNSIYTARPSPPNVGDMRAIMPLEAAPPTDILIVEFYTGFAPFGTTAAPTAVVPGTYQITGSQLQYADCGVCVRIGTNAMMDGMYEDDYLATGGSVTVTTAESRVGGTLTFSLSNITFEHVTIDETTFQSTPVGDGCTTGISGTHTSMLAAPPAGVAGNVVAIPLGTRARR